MGRIGFDCPQRYNVNANAMHQGTVCIPVVNLIYKESCGTSS